MIQRPVEDSWVMDTGSGHHLKSKKKLSPTERRAMRKSVNSLKLKTANGPLVVNEATDVFVEGLGEVTEVRVLPDTPDVLSIGRLVEGGATFHWDANGATLVYRGTLHHLEVHHWGCH